MLDATQCDRFNTVTRYAQQLLQALEDAAMIQVRAFWVCFSLYACMWVQWFQVSSAESNGWLIVSVIASPISKLRLQSPGSNLPSIAARQGSSDSSPYTRPRPLMSSCTHFPYLFRPIPRCTLALNARQHVRKTSSSWWGASGTTSSRNFLALLRRQSLLALAESSRWIPFWSRLATLERTKSSNLLTWIRISTLVDSFTTSGEWMWKG